MPLPYPQRQKQLERLVELFALPNPSAVKWQLLDLALTHPTVSTEANYEQLEFVGDAVVRLAVAEFLMEHFTPLSVGEFSALRSVLVSDRILAHLAREYRLDRYLLVANSAVNDKLGAASRLAEAFEALLGALYLSTHSMELVRPWLDPHLHQLVPEILSDPARQNYKAALQEWTQAHYKCLPEYRVREIKAADLEHRFMAEVWLQNQCLGVGQGRSIKAAEQAAAQVAYLSTCDTLRSASN
jgi:ribonuclease III